jgi:quinol monooxygenase YgiN
MSQLQVIARYTVTAGKEDEVLALLARLADAARAEPGNVAFVVYRRVDDDREVVLLERYLSAAALDDHRATAHFKDLVLDQIVPLLDRREVETYDVVE